MPIGTGTGWSPNGGYVAGNGPPLLGGQVPGPRVGPPLFFEDQTPGDGGSFLQYRVAGITLDMAGAVLASCTVKLYDTLTDALLQTTTSDGLGAYVFTVSVANQQYYIVAYKASAPDVYGTTINTITGLS